MSFSLSSQKRYKIKVSYSLLKWLEQMNFHAINFYSNEWLYLGKIYQQHWPPKATICNFYDCFRSKSICQINNKQFLRNFLRRQKNRQRWKNQLKPIIVWHKFDVSVIQYRSTSYLYSKCLSAVIERFSVEMQFMTFI